jgi:hypothetical protein
MQDAVPSKVLEFGERNQLGEFVRCHRGPTLASILRSNIRTYCMIATVYALIMVLIGNAKIHTNFLNLPNFLKLFIIWFCFIFFCTESFQILRTYGARIQRVYEFDRGIVVTKRRLVLHSLHWEALSSLTYENVEPTFSGFKLSIHDNEKCVLYCHTIIPRIEQEIMSRDLPDILARYGAGEILKFGKIRVDKEGITTGSYNNRDGHKKPIKSIRWGEVYLQVKEYGLSISFIKKADGKSFRISLFNIPNACLLRALLQSILSPTRDIFQQQIQIADSSPDMLR